MARPQNEILITAYDGDNTWSIIAVPDYWIMTYQGKPVTIRTENDINGYKKYKRTCYATEASAKNAVIKLNQLFNTVDFGYRRG